MNQVYTLNKKSLMNVQPFIIMVLRILGLGFEEIFNDFAIPNLDISCDIIQCYYRNI